MKTQQPVLTTSILAVDGLTAQRFAGLDGKVCAAGAKALGVCDADTGAGEMAPVHVLGIVLVETAGAVTAATEVQSDAEGRAVPKAAGISNGIALDAAVEAGALIRIVRGI